MTHRHRPATGGRLRVPSFSAIVPVHNEARIVDDSVGRLVRGLRELAAMFEVVVCENGSTDGTRAVLDRLAERYPEVRTEHLDTADYGRALVHGIQAAKHDVVIIFNVDFWSTDFARTALPLLARHDLVIGSKRMVGSVDQRPPLRRVITWAFNTFLAMTLGFRGSDTHGMKAFRRDPVAEIARSCVTEQWIFDTELVLRAERAGLGIVEIPVAVAEIRPPSYWSLVKRAPRTSRNILRLARAIRSLPR